jgi:chemotaxis protein methyltransferase CheR
MADTMAMRKADAPGPKLTPETFRHLRDLIYEMTGIYFQDNKTYLLESRLLPRLKACLCPTFESYLSYLRFDAYRDREVTELYTVITTNETYFFRDEAQLETFMKIMVPEVMKTNASTKQLRIWSAACSTGDEPYTLALMLRDYLPLAGWMVDILATDISENVLAIARAATYSSHSLRKVPPALRARYFTGSPEHQTLAPQVKDMVRFMNVNLYDRPRLKLVRGMDIVFCRNCLIYFDDKAKAQIVSDLRDALRPRGYLMIGFSETLHDTTGHFRAIHAGRSVIHEKQ